MTLPLSPADSLIVSTAVQSVPRRSFRDRWTFPLLLLLTLIAGVLRFVSLDRPSIWGDEAATYGRVAGTYQQLLDQLADSSFPPLHYELEWWIAQGLPYWGTFDKPDDPNAHAQFTPTRFLVPGGIRLTPFALRFIPALAGTLFVPAIFVLTVQFFGRRIALTAAALACFSAYALVFSRDAKMYMHFWLFVTLHVACVLWWVRTRRLLPWACWVLCGLIMVGLHGSGFAILLIDALIVFTSPRQHWLGFFTAGPVAIWNAVLLPARAYGFVQRRRGHGDGTGWHRIAVWRRRAWRRFYMPVVVPLLAGMLIFAAAAQGPYGFYSAFSRKIQRVAQQEPAQVDLGELGIGWVEPYNVGRTLPDYLLYTASAYLTGWEWPRHYSQTDMAALDGSDETINWKSVRDDGVARFNGRDFKRASLKFVAIVNGGERAAPFMEEAKRYLEQIQRVDDQAHSNARTLWLLQTATVGLLGLLAIGIVPWRRLFQRGRARLDRIFQDGRVWRPVRSRRVLWIGVWLTVIPWAMYTQSIQVPLNLFDGVAKIVLITPPQIDWPRCPVIVGNTASDNWAKAKETFASLRSHWPAAWRSYSAAWTQDNVNRPAAAVGSITVIGLVLLVLIKRRAIGYGAMRLTGVIVLLLALSAIIGVLPRKIDSDGWLPRYLGTMLPAFFVFIAVLVDRQPVLMRWLTIGLFVVVNMGQFSARVWGYADPPTALMAADVVASQPKAIVVSQPDRVTFRAYTDLSFNRYRSAEPGGGTLYTPAGRYYMRMLSGVPGNLLGVRGLGRNGFYEDALQMRPFSSAEMIERDLRDSPQIERFVVWTGLPAGELDLNEEIGDRLYGRFRRVNDEVWPVRDHWRWYDRFQVRRRTYERVPSPPAKSVVNPSWPTL